MDFEKLREIEELASKKEKEWKQVTNLQISSLQTALAEKEKEYKKLNEMFLKLKDDFKYNLKLLQDRDRELKQYDESFAKVKTQETSHIAEISDLRIKLVNLTDSLEREQQARCEMQRHYRQSLIDKQAEMEAFKSTKNAEVEETLYQTSQERARHERVEAQLRSEIDSQRFELTSELDNALVKKDRENREKEDKMKAEVLSHELKYKLLEKELDLVKSAQAKQAETLCQADEVGSKLKKKLQEAEADIQDISAIKNARILELEAKVQNMEAKNASLVRDYEERRKQLDKDIRLKQANMDTVRKAFLDKEKELEDQVRKLETKVETCNHETRRALWDRNDADKENQVVVANLKKEIQDMQFRFENQSKINSTSVVAKDVEIQNLKKKEDLLRAESERLKEDIERYKRELAAASQKENLLLQSKVQLKMDWQRRCQELEQKKYAESEALIQSLTKSRDRAVAEVRKLRRELGYEGDYVEDESQPVLSQQLDDLQKQNEQLKLVVQQMTTELQNLASTRGQTSAPDSRDHGRGDAEVSRPAIDGVSSEYVKSLEEELLSLKKERRNWEERKDAEGGSAAQNPFPPTHPPQATDAFFAHPEVQAHITFLNKTIGDLRADKTDTSAQLQKVQVRLHHQENLLHSRESELKKQVARIQELEYELSSAKRRNNQEIESLKKRIADLELQLAETRREADEYYRGGIQNNLRATELGDKISQMTVNAASKTPWMSDVVQAKQVQQLQLELTELRKELAKTKQELILGKLSRNPSKAAALNQQLREKLQLAAEQMSLLMREKAQILEVGNSLRAELESVKCKKAESDGATREADRKSVDHVHNKLKEMEDLQYQLTRQELQYAQRASPRKLQPPVELQTPQTTSTPTVPTKETRLHRSDSTITGDLRSKPLQYSLSSLGDNSLKDVWKMLDQEPSSPSLLESKENGRTVANMGPAKSQVQTIHARSPRLQQQQQQVRTKRSKAPKIRNYNIRNDEEARLVQNRSHARKR